MLNPNFSIMTRTATNAMPAVQTDLELSTHDLLRFMIQWGRFRDPNGSIAQDRVEAAHHLLNVDHTRFQIERFKVRGFDPERPHLEITHPDWERDPNIATGLATYLQMKRDMLEALDVVKSGANDEYLRAKNALLMCQRVDLWCAGEKETEQAVIHLYKLAKALNKRELKWPGFLNEFIPGVGDMEDP
jgi:hypothetical protein